MRRTRITVIGISLILATTLMGAGVPSALAGARRHNPDRHQMLKATNHSRLTRGLGRLSLNDKMSAIAERHSEAMATRGYLFHTPNALTYLKGIQWHSWGENIGFTKRGGTAEDLQRAFMHSAVHRENILNRSFKHVAIGAVSRGGVLWVTVFFYG